MPTPEQRREYRRRWRVKNPDYSRQWYLKNRQKCIDRARQWELSNLEKVRQKQRQYVARNKEKVMAAKRRWKKSNPDKILELSRRRRLNPHHRLREALSSRINQALNKRSCGIKTIEILGCSLDNFIIYLESLWQVGMSWDNYGRNGWNVDHIMPCAIFDLTKPEHQKRCFHFSNLQPMWEFDNCSKRDKLTTNQFNLL